MFGLIGHDGSGGVILSDVKPTPLSVTTFWNMTCPLLLRDEEPMVPAILGRQGRGQCGMILITKPMATAQGVNLSVVR